VQSWFGWPVPAPVLLATRERVAELVAVATARGFSRKGDGLDLEAGQTFVVIPYLPESSPEPSSMCLVVEFPHSIDLENGIRPQCSFSRLDVSEEDLKSLPAAKARVRDQLLHWMAWEAYRGRS
jgi:hypothetical protein